MGIACLQTRLPQQQNQSESAVEAEFGIGFVSRWVISKELELGALKVGELRHTGPEPQGPADAFRTFALGRARLLSNAQRKPYGTPEFWRTTRFVVDVFELTSR